MEQLPKTIYVIMQSSGSYDTFHINNLGFAYTEKEAKKIVNEINNIDTPKHPIAGEQYNNPDYYNILGKFEEISYEWEEIENDLYDEHEETVIPGYDKTKIPHVYDPELYAAHMAEFEKEILKKKIEWYNNNEKLEPFLPAGKTWEQVFTEIDAYDVYLQEDLGDAFYEELTLM